MNITARILQGGIKFLGGSVSTDPNKFSADFRKWMESEEGKTCLSLEPDKLYLDKRLHLAFSAGMKSVGKYSQWNAATTPVPPELITDPNNPEGTLKMLLLVVPFHPTPVRGWFYAGRLNQFRSESSVGEVKPTYWMPMPTPPA